MKKIFMRPLFKCSMLLSCCLAVWGCASVTEDSGETSTPDTPCTGDGCETTCTGDDCGEKDECSKDNDCTGGKVCSKGKCTAAACTGDDCNKKDECSKDNDCSGEKVCTQGKCTDPETPDPPVVNTCPSEDYSACSTGTTRTFCKDGKLEFELCSDGCQSGACIEPHYTNNSCDKPYVVPPNQIVTGSTESGASYDSSVCSADLKPMMGVFKLEVPATGRYEISINNKSTNSWGNLLATECPMINIISDNCPADSSDDTFIQYMSAGDYYLFVAPANLLSNHFEASVSFVQKDGKYCGYTGKLNPLELKNDVWEQDDEITDPVSIQNWDEWHGCSTGGTGVEKAYIISVNKKSTIKAELTVQVEDGDENPGTFALHTFKCSNTWDNGGSGNPDRCSSGTPNKAIELTQNVDVGSFILFVDSDRQTAYKYHLKVTRTDAK